MKEDIQEIIKNFCAENPQINMKSEAAQEKLAEVLDKEIRDVYLVGE